MQFNMTSLFPFFTPDLLVRSEDVGALLLLELPYSIMEHLS